MDTGNTMSVLILRMAGAGIVAALIAFVPPLSLIVQVIWTIFHVIAADTLAATNTGGLEGFVISSMPHLFVGSVLLSIGYTVVAAVESHIIPR